MTPRVECGPLTAAQVPEAAAIETAVADGWSAVGIRGALASSGARCFAAQLSGKVKAFAAFTLAADEANLDALSVAPDARRQGLARCLLAYALAECAKQGAKTCYLEVRESNCPARRLYESLRFIQTGIRRNFYTNPSESAVLMKKEL